MSTERQASLSDGWYEFRVDGESSPFRYVRAAVVAMAGMGMKTGLSVASMSYGTVRLLASTALQASGTADIPDSIPSAWTLVGMRVVIENAVPYGLVRVTAVNADFMNTERQGDGQAIAMGLGLDPDNIEAWPTRRAGKPQFVTDAETQQKIDIAASQAVTSERVRIMLRLSRMFDGDFLANISRHCGLNGESLGSISPALAEGNDLRMGDLRELCASLSIDPESLLQAARSSIGLPSCEAAVNYEALVISSALASVRALSGERDRCAKIADNSHGSCGSGAPCCSCSWKIEFEIRKG